MKFKKLLNLLRNSKKLFKRMWNDPPLYDDLDFDNESLWEIPRYKSKKKDERIEKRPIDIYEQIISEKPKINLNDIDRQIKLVKERMKVLKQHIGDTNLKSEKMAIDFLKARKKYLEYKDEFKWAITNKEMIDKLCKKYKVRLVSIKGYYENIPKEGVDEIKKFGEAFQNVSDEDPVFKLIVDENGKETKKDPILLVRSPFGNWYYILGAWDKEVEIVDDLIYNRK